MITSTTWRQYAACRTGTRHPDTWHSSHPGEQAEARAVCQACPTLAACRTAVLAAEVGLHADDRHGIHAALDGPERAALDPTAPDTAPRLLMDCGHPAAYKRHRRRGEQVDERCAQANRRYHAERTAKAAA